MVWPLIICISLFFKQKTAYVVRISFWSSDVCSSDLAWLAFVSHDPRLNEIHFCYHSGDRFARFQSGEGCNRAAVYNYRLDNWTFYDLPNVTSGCLSTVRSEEHTSELQSLMRISYAVFCLKKKTPNIIDTTTRRQHQTNHIDKPN